MVELLVGLSVSAVVLAALAGLLFTVSDRASQWGQRVNEATNAFGVASAVQADGHRSVPCHLITQQRQPQELFFCLPVGCQDAAQYDASQAGQGSIVTRIDLADPGPVRVVVGRLPNTTTFTIIGPTGTVISINGTGSTPGGSMMVYLNPPAGSCP